MCFQELVGKLFFVSPEQLVTTDLDIYNTLAATFRFDDLKMEAEKLVNRSVEVAKISQKAFKAFKPSQKPPLKNPCRRFHVYGT
jgi:hypothetical protein